jgi:RES domain-containing protein
LQQVGDAWLEEGKYPVMKIPSVVIPEEFNYLVNPLHPEAEGIYVINQQPFVFDQRLKEGRK